MSEWIVVHDSPRYKGSLYRVGFNSREAAEKEVNKILTNPSRDDEYNIRVNKFFNFRPEEVKNEMAWWNDPFLAN